MDVAGLLLFAGVYFVAVASPGPGLAAVVARGLAKGTVAGPAFVAGFVIGDLIMFTLAALGLAAIAQSFEALFLVIKYAGCAYLLWMAWTIWTAPVTPADVGAASSTSTNQSVNNSWPAFLGSLSLTLGNPKVIVFFLSIMPIVVDMKSMTPVVFIELAVVIVLVITPVVSGALLLANRARRVFTSERALRRINRSTAAVMAGAAAMIAARG